MQAALVQFAPYRHGAGGGWVKLQVALVHAFPNLHGMLGCVNLHLDPNVQRGKLAQAAAPSVAPRLGFAAAMPLLGAAKAALEGMDEVAPAPAPALVVTGAVALFVAALLSLAPPLGPAPAPRFAPAAWAAAPWPTCTAPAELPALAWVGGRIVAAGESICCCCCCC